MSPEPVDASTRPPIAPSAMLPEPLPISIGPLMSPIV